MPFTTKRNIWYPDKTTSVAPLHTNFALLAQSVADELSKVHYTVSVPTVADAKSLPIGQAFYITSVNRYGYSVAPGNIRLYPLNIVGNRIRSNGQSGGSLVPGASESLITSTSMNVTDDVLATYVVSATIRITGNIQVAGELIVDVNGQRTSARWHSNGREGDQFAAAQVSSTVYGMTRGQSQVFAAVLATCDQLSQGSAQVMQVSTTLEAML